MRRSARACAKSLQVLTTRRCSQVENCDSPRNWRIRTTSFASDSCAASRASSGSRSRWSAIRSTRGAWRSQSAASAVAVAGLRPRHENRVGEPLVGESGPPNGSGIGADWTARREAGLHGGPTLDGDGARARDSSCPGCAGSFGRPYLYAAETPSTQTMPPDDAPHGTVALAEHQTAGRGRLGRVWVDEPGTGLAFSVVLRPPPPVARWPELTLVAAEAVAGAIGAGATIKHPNDVLVEGRKVAGILAEAARARRARDRRQRRRGAVARRRVRRPRPPRAARRDPRPASSRATSAGPRRPALELERGSALRPARILTAQARLARGTAAQPRSPRLPGAGRTGRRSAVACLAIHFVQDVEPGHAELARRTSSTAAHSDHYAAAVILLDTPGGLEDSMRTIVQKELQLSARARR